MEETYGDQDLYVSFRQKQNVWSKPVNLGPVINSSKVEFAPFLASDNKTLYFSSNGHGGYGESDIFYTKRLDDSWQNWSEPINIGGDVNTPSWDGYYAVAAKGDYAYFVSTAGGLKKVNLNPTDEDIFRIALKEEVRPDPVILITGRVLNSKTKEPIEANIFYESLPLSKEDGIAISDPNAGTYKITLPAGKKYGFRAESEGFLSVSRNEDFSEITEYTEIDRDLLLTPIEVGQIIQLNNLFFVQSKAEILPESMPELERLYNLMMEQPALQIELGGHTDNQGIYAANLRLSQERADAVMEFLVEKGVPKKRIKAVGDGPSKPVASNKNPETRKQNRRVEIKILKR
jgi:outer membrane protein OmpA-like peptidoglycan-associated protein